MSPEKEDERKKFRISLTGDGWEKPSSVEVKAHHFNPPGSDDPRFHFYEAGDKEDEDIFVNAEYVVCVVPV